MHMKENNVTIDINSIPMNTRNNMIYAMENIKKEIDKIVEENKRKMNSNPNAGKNIKLRN